MMKYYVLGKKGMFLSAGGLNKNPYEAIKFFSKKKAIEAAKAHNTVFRMYEFVLVGPNIVGNTAKVKVNIGIINGRDRAGIIPLYDTLCCIEYKDDTYVVSMKDISTCMIVLPHGGIIADVEESERYFPGISNLTHSGVIKTRKFGDIVSNGLVLPIGDILEEVKVTNNALYINGKVIVYYGY